jgi:uncharacterized protein (TIGR02453 family)
MPDFTGFRPRALTFLRELARNNRREWFQAHREEYERELKQPMIALVEEIDARLATLAPEIIGDAKRSVFRIYRDVRFSKDKAPYKTNAACWFYHRDAGKGVGGEAAHGGAGFYFNLEPNASQCGGGIWMPPQGTLKRIRAALAEGHNAFTRTVSSPAFRRRFGDLDEGAMLNRLPRGFLPAHPASRWLRYKSFTAGRALTAREVTSPRLPDILEKDFALLLPAVRWLNAALGLRAHARR